MSVVVWHNPRCSKSRATLKLLQDRGIELEVRLYLEIPPSAAELRQALAALGLSAYELVRTGEPAWKESGLDRASDEVTLIDCMVRTPKLIERPIVFNDSRARVGRPPEAVLELFDQV